MAGTGKYDIVTETTFNELTGGWNLKCYPRPNTSRFIVGVSMDILTEAVIDMSPAERNVMFDRLFDRMVKQLEKKLDELGEGKQGVPIYCSGPEGICVACGNSLHPFLKVGCVWAFLDTGEIVAGPNATGGGTRPDKMPSESGQYRHQPEDWPKLRIPTDLKPSFGPPKSPNFQTPPRHFNSRTVPDPDRPGLYKVIDIDPGVEAEAMMRGLRKFANKVDEAMFRAEYEGQFDAGVLREEPRPSARDVAQVAGKIPPGKTKGGQIFVKPEDLTTNASESTASNFDLNALRHLLKTRFGDKQSKKNKESGS